MKRFFNLRKTALCSMLCLVCSSSFVGCGNNNPTSATVAQSQSTPETTAPTIITTEAPTQATTQVDNDNVEIIAEVWYAPEVSGGDTQYITIVYGVQNNSTTKVATFPKITASLKNDKGEIVGTGEQTGTFIMPQDTILQSVHFSILKSDYDPEKIRTEAVITWKYSDTPGSLKGASSKDFKIENVTKRTGSDYGKITGELVSNFKDTLGRVQLTIVVWDSESNTRYTDIEFISDVANGISYPFSFDYIKDLTEEDEYVISVSEWY